MKGIILRNYQGNELIRLFEGGQEVLPEQLIEPDYTNIVAARDNNLVRLVSGNIEWSKDNGKTWISIANTYGTITNIHFFASGRMMFCTNTNVYYTDDGITINQSTIRDINGNIATLSGYHFFQQRPLDRIVIVDGVEVHVFGDYIIGGTASVWATDDGGETVREIMRSGITVSFRHIHQVCFNDWDKRFYVITGDGGNDCNVLRLTYNAGSFTYDRLVSGDNFKFGQLLFDRDFCYCITDYTGVGATKGILRVPTSKMDRATEYKYIYKQTDIGSNVGITTMCADANGKKIMALDINQPGYVLLALHGLEFRLIPVQNSATKHFNIFTTGPDYNGRYYSAVAPFRATNEGCALVYPTVELTAWMAKNNLVWRSATTIDRLWE